MVKFIGTLFLFLLFENFVHDDMPNTTYVQSIVKTNNVF